MDYFKHVTRICISLLAFFIFTGFLIFFFLCLGMGGCKFAMEFQRVWWNQGSENTTLENMETGCSNV